MRILMLIIALLVSLKALAQTNVSNIKVEDLNRDELAMSAIIDDDRHTLISVGGTWCKPCLLQKPFVASLGQQYPQYLKVVFLFWRDTPEKIKLKFGATSELENYFLATYSIIEQLNINTYPTHILVDAKGNVISNDVSINDVGDLIK